jgi:hypothetical protein
MTIDRRTFLEALAAAAAALALPRRAGAIGEKTKFRVAQLAVSGGNWNPRPTAVRRLLWELDKRTSIDAAVDGTQVTLGEETLFENPFLYLAGDRTFAPLSDRELELLHRFLTFGGFLLIDSAEGRTGGAFDASVRRMVGDLFPHPATGLEAVPADHVIYKSFYLLDDPVGRVAVANQLEQVVHDGRAAIVYCQNDLGGAWARDNYGVWEHECYPGGERQRELAFRLGINLAMYALCLDYKADQVHVEFILRRRRWKADPDNP